MWWRRCGRLCGGRSVKYYFGPFFKHGRVARTVVVWTIPPSLREGESDSLPESPLLNESIEQSSSCVSAESAWGANGMKMLRTCSSGMHQRRGRFAANTPDPALTISLSVSWSPRALSVDADDLLGAPAGWACLLKNGRFSQVQAGQAEKGQQGQAQGHGDEGGEDVVQDRDARLHGQAQERPEVREAGTQGEGVTERGREEMVFDCFVSGGGGRGCFLFVCGWAACICVTCRVRVTRRGDERDRGFGF